MNVSPLDPLSAAELTLTTKVLLASGRIGAQPQFAWAALHEPTKAELAAGAPPRRAFASSVDRVDGASYESVVDLQTETVFSSTKLSGLHAQITWTEVADAAPVVQDERVVAALARRGVTDLKTVTFEPWPAGHFGRPYDGGDKRLVHCVFYVKAAPGDQQWARPVQGLVAVWDRVAGELVELMDDGGNVPTPTDPGRFDAESVGVLRQDLKPLEVLQPDGPSFTLDGHKLTWQRWSMRLAMHPVEGLVLHQVGYQDPAVGRTRSILHRAAMAEMAVPYGDPQLQHFWRHVFDEGEVGMGRTANPLTLGCDCLGEIRYLDAPMLLPDGTVAVTKNAICIHEEDAGILWRHFDRDAGVSHVRRARRLVVSYWATLGNYDYGYYWCFYQDGSIEVEVRLSGVVLASATTADAPTSPYAARLTSTLEGPHHQHFFCFRLDLDIDGTTNVVEEVDVVAEPEGPDNPYGSAFRPVVTPLWTEAGAQRSVDPTVGRSWKILNPDVRNALGDPVAYQLHVPASPRLLAGEGSAAGKRAAFARHHLWVTAYDPTQTRAAGDYPSLHPGAAGLPSYAAADRSLVDSDVVLWVTVGANHVARPEEWPVMPVERLVFGLKPAGFFDRNPALDVPPQQLVNPTSCAD